MTTLKLTLVCLGLLVINLRNVQAISEAEKNGILNAVLPYALECTSEFDIGIDISKLLRSLDDLDGINPCFIACVIKKLKLINDKGLVDIKVVPKLGKKYLSGEEDLKQGLEIISKCTTVNEKEVGDGEKGCERAKLFAECVLPHRHIFLPGL